MAAASAASQMIAVARKSRGSNMDSRTILLLTAGAVGVYLIWKMHQQTADKQPTRLTQAQAMMKELGT
jgi:hypothetical protein